MGSKKDPSARISSDGGSGDRQRVVGLVVALWQAEGGGEFVVSGRKPVSSDGGGGWQQRMVGDGRERGEWRREEFDGQCFNLNQTAWEFNTITWYQSSNTT